MKKNKNDKVVDKAEKFIDIFIKILKNHPQLKKIKIEGEKTNIVIERILK
jgi:hypothetical protein